MPRYVLQVVVETEENYTKKGVREALQWFICRAPELMPWVKRIYVRREVVKQ